MNISISAPRLLQMGLGAAGLVGGFAIASSTVRTAYREDLVGDPNRVVEIDDRTMIYQTREPQGGKLTNFTMGAGAASAFAGGALLLGAAPGLSGVQSLLRTGGGAALFALGIGAIAGATAMAAQYDGADFVPVR
jgi:hypothetical protein